MSPEKAEIIIVDDNEDRSSSLATFLIRAGHQILGIATTRKEAEKIIAEIKKLDVALLDGNLDPTESNPHMFGVDGEHLAKLVRQKFPQVKVISISGRPQDWSDTPLLRGGAEIAEAVTKA